MIADPAFPVIGLVVGSAAVGVWSLVLVRSLWAWRTVEERRASYVVMAGTAFLASIGTLASAVGFAVQRGVLELAVNPDVLSAIASMGRGALLTGGLIVATHYRPGADRP